jgi:nucleotide-binding universal stress UspA family protein
MFDHIVVAVDGGDSGLRAVRATSALAGLSHAKITLVHVHPCALAISSGERRRVEREMHQQGRAALAEAQEACGGRARPVLVASSSPARGLTEQAEALGADLIVLGSSQRSGMERALAGDTARAVLHGAPCAVALVPRDGSIPNHGKRVSAGWNGSPESEAALRCAMAVTEAADGTLMVVRAVSPPVAFAPRYAYAYDWTGMAAIARDRAQERLDERLHETTIAARGEAIVGSTSKVLEAVSRDADVLVLGSRGFGPVRRILVGSTVEGLVVHAHCILQVLPRPGSGAKPGRGQPKPVAASAQGEGVANR